MTQRPSTIAELRETGYRSRSVKEELRANIIEALAKKKELFRGIVGYEATVVPQIENALLSGQDIILLGERGQAKTRIARQLIELLDESVPAIGGCEINDDPFARISAIPRSSRRRTSPSRTSSVRSTRSRSPRDAISPTSSPSTTGSCRARTAGSSRSTSSRTSPSACR